MSDRKNSDAGLPSGAERTPLRIVMFGTPEFAVPTLERLAADARFDVVLAVTQPDRPAGRGRRLEPPPLKRAASRFGIPVYQPASLRVPSARQPLAEAQADLFVVAAYGVVFGRKTLALPRLGCINLHASLLPKYRGASPIAAAILAGDAETGVSLMVMEPGLDTGPVVATIATPIAATDTTASLTARLAEMGADVAMASLPRFAQGDLAPKPQPVAGASLTRPLMKSDGRLDWRLSADDLERRVRAFWPWPRAWTTAGSGALQVHAARPVVLGHDAAPGTILPGTGFVVACGHDALEITTAQPAGGRAIAGREVIAGRLVRAGEVLPSPDDATPIVAPVAVQTSIDPLDPLPR